MTLEPGISVVVPVYNSHSTLAELTFRVSTALAALDLPGEIVLVDDGSSDGSWDVIADLARRQPAVRGIRLARNYGQHNALLCGLRHARHETTVTLDDDLQHPPEEIASLLKRLGTGADVVYGVPRAMPHSWWRNLTSRVVKSGLAKLVGNGHIRDISAFRAFRTSLREAARNYRSPRLALDELLSWGTQRFAAVAVEHHPRRVGRSNYSFAKLLDWTLLLLTSFGARPLRLAGLAGLSLLGGGLAVLGTTLALAWWRGAWSDWSSLPSLLATFSGVQLLTLSVLGEYLLRVHDRSQDRPTYCVGEQTDADRDLLPFPARDRQTGTRGPEFAVLHGPDD